MSSDPSDTTTARLAKTYEDVVVSNDVSSSTLTTTFATIVARNDTVEFLDTIKFLVQIRAVSTVSITSATATICIYNYTDAKDVATITVSLNDTVTNFKNNPNITVDFKTVGLYGLRTKISTSYDTVWQVKIAVSDPSLSFSIQSMQRLYYKL